MRIGVDLHGVIDDDPAHFKRLLDQLMKAFDVCIISGPPKNDIIKELEKHDLHEGLHFEYVYSVVDHLKEKGVEMWQDERGRWWASDEEWWKAKAEICEKESVDLLIDDKEEWGTHFKNIKTKFLLYGGQDED